MRNTEAGRTGAVRPLWSEAETLRERISQAHGLFAFFSFDAALAQRAAHGHLRTNPAARAMVCHVTGGRTNPVVEIYIPGNASAPRKSCDFQQPEDWGF